MKRISRDPQKFDLMKMLDQFARSRGLDIHNQANQEAFVAELAKQIAANRNNKMLVHGLRVQAMFAFVAAALGKCSMIKEEDAGELYTEDLIMRSPDFRIVTIGTHEQLLVEVKNCHAIDFDKGYRFTRTYLDGLKLYASRFNTQLFIAIYWSKPNLWMLICAEDFELRNQGYVLPLPEAMKRNKMHILGDQMIGCIPSFTLKFLSDPDKPRTVDASGRSEFTIGKAELYCGSQLVEADLEKKIVWFLIRYGRWPGHELPPEIISGEVISLGFRVEPEKRSNPNQHFEIVGYLSEMVSRQFNDITAPDGSVKLLSPKRELDALGVAIPPDYSGQLPLWRFNVNPLPALPSDEHGAGHGNQPNTSPDGA